jgi:NitT/TauT family transport system ATP-binding protein
MSDGEKKSTETASPQPTALGVKEAISATAPEPSGNAGKSNEAVLAAAEAALHAFETSHRAEAKPPAKPPTTAASSRPHYTPGPPPPVVLFDHVTKTYGAGSASAFTAIKDVSFVVEDLPGKGEFICLLGPSGCGKSTVLRLIAGLEPQHPPTMGRVEVFGQPVAGPGADRGMVFQSYTSFDHRTVIQNVAFGLECQGIPRKTRLDLAREWIGKVGLSVDNDSDKYPHQLSGGMQQRVAIARTLILKPRIILMDEPFGALDPITRSQMQDLIVELWREVEATVFFITHSIEESVYLADRVYLFSNSPGTILRQFAVPPPDRSANEMQRDPAFQNVVYELRDLIDRLEHEQVQAKSAAAGG